MDHQCLQGSIWDFEVGGKLYKALSRRVLGGMKNSGF